jgi:predicted DNA binding protein
VRRLILEFPRDEVGKIEGDSSPLLGVRSMEVLLLLKHTPEEITMICRAVLEDDVSDIREYLRRLDSTTDQVRIIEHEGKGSYVVFVRHRPKQTTAGRYVFGEVGGYVVSREVREGNFRVTYLGSAAQIRRTLRMLERSGLRYKIMQLTDARFSSDSPLSVLTEKQRRVLITAYRLGYYDLPRRISSERLSKALNLHKSAVATHRRKAELRILAEVLRE